MCRCLFGWASEIEDGRIELDKNSVERVMRPVALSNKIVCSPIVMNGRELCMLGFADQDLQLKDVNPQAYFADPLTRLVNGWPQKHMGELMELGAQAATLNRRQPPKYSGVSLTVYQRLDNRWSIACAI
jgi:hypothetical protein